MGKVKSDIEIARQAKMKPIQEVLNGLTYLIKLNSIVQLEDI